MMGHREEIRTGDEMDVFSSYTKRDAARKRRFRSSVKTKFSRRVRREVRAKYRHYNLTDFHNFVEFVAVGEPKPEGWWTG